jgi:hypothetical protein
MKHLQTEIIIDAPAEEIWTQLMDFDAYHQWNPFIQSIVSSGDLAVGNRITAVIKPGDKKAQTFKPVVKALEPNKELRWLGSASIKGIFDGEHYFILEEMAPNQTRFLHGERFSGILVGLVMRMIGDDTLKGFEAMNVALKKRCEG